MKNKITFNMAFDFINQYSGILPGERFLVLKIMNILGNDPGGEVEMSAANLSKDTGNSTRTTQRYIAKLKEKEILYVENNFFKDNMIASNRYKVPGWKDWVEEKSCG